MFQKLDLLVYNLPQITNIGSRFFKSYTIRHRDGKEAKMLGSSSVRVLSLMIRAPVLFGFFVDGIGNVFPW